MKYNTKGMRKHRCADCGGFQLERPQAMARRCKPRCKSCGSSFLEPYSEVAMEEFQRTGDAKRIVQPVADGKASPTGREHRSMPQ